jgi:hypothetical protein
MMSVMPMQRLSMLGNVFLLARGGDGLRERGRNYSSVPGRAVVRHAVERPLSMVRHTRLLCADALAQLHTPRS